jgi:hypothetical protein
VIFRPSRSRAGPDRWVHHKMLLFVLGAALGLTGVALDSTVLVNIGIVVLLVGVLLRFAGRHREAAALRGDGDAGDDPERDEPGRDGPARADDGSAGDARAGGASHKAP